MTWWKRFKAWCCWWQPREAEGELIIHTDAGEDICACDACFSALLSQAEALWLQLDLLASVQELRLTPGQSGRLAGEVKPEIPVIPREVWQGLARTERLAILQRCAITIEAEEVKMLHKFPDEIDHEDLINHEVAHSLVQALLIGRPTSIELRADGNGYAEGVLLSELGLTEAQRGLIGLHVSIAGVSQAFTTKAWLKGEWPEGCAQDVKNAMEYAHRLKSTDLFSFDVSAASLVHIAAGMSAYLVLKQFEDVSQAMRWRLSQKSWDTLWTAGQVEDFLILQPSFVTHTPLLTATDWVRRWAAWGDATTDWLDRFDEAPQRTAEGIYARLAEQLQQRRPIGGLRP